MADITSFNAVILISVPLLLPVPQQLQGFAADDIYDIARVAVTETSMGVDGTLSGGVVLAPIDQTFSMQADSPSISFFDAWYHGQIALGAVAPAQGNTTLTSVQTTFQQITGFLIDWDPMPAAKRILQPRRALVRWQSIIAIPVGIAG